MNNNYPSTDADKLLLAVQLQKDNIDSVVNIVKGVSDKVDNIDNKLEAFKTTTDTRLDAIENREEITYEMQNRLDALISQTVYNRLGIGPNPAKWTLEERVINNKYGRLFRKRLRLEVSQKGHLAYPYRTTQKGNFIPACNDIEAWYPRNGIDGLKREADDNAIARKIAKEQGY